MAAKQLSNRTESCSEFDLPQIDSSFRLSTQWLL